MSGLNRDNKEKLAFLDDFSTKHLESLLRQDVWANAEDGNGEEYILYIMEVLERRYKESDEICLSDLTQAKRDFDALYNTPDGEGQSLYGDEGCNQNGENIPKQSPNAHPLPRKRNYYHPVRIVFAAAVIVALFTIVASAFGLNVFDAIGNWTKEYFTFNSEGNTVSHWQGQTVGTDSANDEIGFSISDNVVSYNSIADALDVYNLGTNTVPSYIPENFFKTEVTVTDYMNETNFCRIYAVYSASLGDKSLVLEFVHGGSNSLYEKSAENPVIYTAHEVLFYIFENFNQCIVAYCTNGWECSFSGDITVAEAKMMIDSIFDED